MDNPAVQDFYPTEYAYCYGCGRLNTDGLHVQSRWLDASQGKSIARFIPRPYHTALPGFVYGGLLASLVDCHGTGTAALAAYHAENRPFESLPANRFVTASLHVDFMKPTPLTELELIGQVTDIKMKDDRTKKVVVAIIVYAGNQPCVKGEVVAVQVPENFGVT
jgi:acyl-coenzyme A thioesterase PaaI-like protein